jgi:transcriptional regulator with XRE-family HTH domain
VIEDDMKVRQKKDFVGAKVRRLRKERSMTQSELATRIGIIQSDLCRMEKGEYKVSLEVLFRVLQVFGMNIGEFFSEADRASGPAVAEAELTDCFRSLSEGSQMEVLDYIRFKSQQERRDDEVADDPAIGKA